MFHIILPLFSNRLVLDGFVLLIGEICLLSIVFSLVIAHGGGHEVLYVGAEGDSGETFYVVLSDVHVLFVVD